jgi:hypothetical protein
MKALFTFAVFLSLLAVPRLALGQSLTEEEITGVMEAPAVKGDFIACAQGQAAGSPALTLELVLKVEPDGQVQLSSTLPKTEGTFLTCLQMVAKRIKFRATGQALEVTYPMEFPAQTPAPGPQTEAGQNVVVLPEETPQPAPSAGTAAAGAAPAGTKPGMFTDPQWEAEYYQGRNMVIAGAILLPISALAFLSSGLCWMITGIICLAKDDDEDDKECTMARISGIVSVVSLAVMITSIVILAVGSSKKRHARHYMTAGGLTFDVGFSPLTGGGSGTLALHF